LRIYKDAGNEVVSLLALRAGACEKRSVDEVAIDVSAEADRLLRERSWEEDILPAARASSHLADSALSRSAATVSRSDARNGHIGQQMQESSAEEALPIQGPQTGWDWAFFWGAAERRLIAGAVVVAELRAAVASQLGFSCSGGIAQNKLLAKLGCGLHKPKQQTIVLPEAVGPLLHDLPLERLAGLGGDLGAQVKATLGVSSASELAAVPMATLEATFPRQAAYLMALAEGRHNEPVQDRELNKSLSNGKTFFGRLRLDTSALCEHWLRELAGELHQRYVEDCSKHGRAPTKLSVSIGVGGGGGGMQGSATSSSRQASIDLGRNGSVEQIVTVAFACFRRWLPADRGLGVTSLGLSLSNMKQVETGSSLNFAAKGAIEDFTAPHASHKNKPSKAKEASLATTTTAKVSGPLMRCFAATATASAEPRAEPHPSPAPGPTALHGGDGEPGIAGTGDADIDDVLAIDSGREVSGFGSPADVAADAGPHVTAIDLESVDQPSENVCVAAGLDPAVLAELPPEIRAEVLAGLPQAAQRAEPPPQPPKRTGGSCNQEPQKTNSQKRQRVATSGTGRSITAFFRPAGSGAATAGA